MNHTECDAEMDATDNLDLRMEKRIGSVTLYQ
jgi:hypothetical protein